MSGFYAYVREDGQHGVYSTTDGRDRTVVPKVVFDSPRRAIAYAAMRELNVQPLRSSAVSSGPPSEATAEQPRGRSIAGGDGQ